MKKLTEKYRNNPVYDYSCSETILKAANEKYQLNLSEDTFKMMAPFSGGMLEGDACGILTASISVLGIIFIKDNAHNSPLMKEAVLEYKTKFKEIYKSIDCRNLVEKYRNPETGCTNFIVEASTLLEEVVTKYQNKKYL